MDALIGTFHIDWKLIIAQMVNFAIVLFVLYWFALRPLGTLMNERGAKIKKGLDDAKTNAELREQAKKLYDAEMVRAKQDAQTLVGDMQKEIGKKREELMMSAQSEVDKIFKEGKEKLTQEKDLMLREAEKELATLVVSGVEKVVGKNMSESLNKELVAESLKNLK